MRGLRHDSPVSATLLGIADRIRMRRVLPELAADERADGKSALVTGASSGLGFATAVELGRRGAHVLMADLRDPEDACRRALALAPGGRFEALPVDLSDLASLDRLAGSLEARGPLDLVVLNAGIVPSRARLTKEGLDEMFAVNYFSSFVLLRRLVESGVVAAPGAPGRVVFVASEAHRWAEDRPFADLIERRDPSVARVLAYYGEHKMLLLTLCWELDRRINARGHRAGFFALCPGAMNTGIARDAPRLARPLLGAVMRLFFADPVVAAEPVLYLACSRAMADQSAVYLHRTTPKDPDARPRDPERGRALWEASVALLERLRSQRTGSAAPGPGAA